MAKIGCLKPFRGSYSNLSNVVLEDGEIAFTTDNKRIYMGNGTDSISNLTPYINTGTTDISGIGTGSITSAISTLNSNKADIIDLGDYTSYTDDTDFVNAIASNIKSLFGNDGNVYANITYIRSGSWIGTMEYSPYQNGYISILVHYYQQGYVVHFGTTNGVPFYDYIDNNILFTDNKWWSKVRWTSSDSYGVFLLQAVQSNRNYNFIISFLEGTYKILLDVQNPHQFSDKFSIDFDNNNHLKLSTNFGEGGVINLTSLTKNLTFQYEQLT